MLYIVNAYYTNGTVDRFDSLTKEEADEVIRRLHEPNADGLEVEIVEIKKDEE